MVILLYLVLLIVEGLAEAYVLKRLDWTTWPKALLASWLSNLVGFIIGFSIVFVTVGVTLALAWDGSMQKLPFHGNEALVVLVLVALLLPVLLASLKALTLWTLSIGKGKRRWLFSFVSSLVFWLVPLGVVIILAKLLF